ncbi:hypothetical protein GW915_10675 [bacterium]|nr:hypothetical protein [bacterium]
MKRFFILALTLSFQFSSFASNSNEVAQKAQLLANKVLKFSGQHRYMQLSTGHLDFTVEQLHQSYLDCVLGAAEIVSALKEASLVAEDTNWTAFKEDEIQWADFVKIIYSVHSEIERTSKGSALESALFSLAYFSDDKQSIVAFEDVSQDVSDELHEALMARLEKEPSTTNSQRLVAAPAPQERKSTVATPAAVEPEQVEVPQMVESEEVAIVEIGPSANEVEVPLAKPILVPSEEIMPVATPVLVEEPVATVLPKPEVVRPVPAPTPARAPVKIEPKKKKKHPLDFIRRQKLN